MKRKKEKISITKDDLRDALNVIGGQSRFPFPGRFLVCKEVYKDDMAMDNSNSAVEYDCFNYQDDAIDVLFKELEGKK